MTLTLADRMVLEGAYGWNIIKVTTLHEGENQTYTVRTFAEKYVVRRYRRGRYTPAEVNAELMWLAALKDTVPVVPALPLRSGERYLVRQQTHEIYAAFPYVIGDEPDLPTPSDFERLGQLLRHLHDAAANVLAAKPKSWAGYQRPTYNLQTLVEGTLEPLLQTPLLGNPDKRRCVALGEQLRELYALCNPKTSFVHADLHFGNVLVNGDVWTLLDFDECGFGFPAFDLGTVRFHAVARGQTEGWSAFLAGYGEPRLSELELKLGAAMRIFFAAGKLPLRLDIPEVQEGASGLIQKYLTMTERELADT